MEKKMATTIVYWGYIGIMEKKKETTEIMGNIGFRVQEEWKRTWKLLSKGLYRDHYKNPFLHS